MRNTDRQLEARVAQRTTELRVAGEALYRAKRTGRDRGGLFG